MISLNYTQSEQLNGKMVFQLPQFIHRALLLQAPLYIELITQQIWRPILSGAICLNNSIHLEREVV